MDTPPPGLLILVPARAGSKGLPGKNLKPLGGLPLLGWTARAIAASGVAARAVLTTEDPAIAEAGRSFGLETPFL
ncbi:MAG: acylneuraminate cytidylyltransferase family protein, partial [candidate division NC10 bacterium]